jgi:G patch domain/KOW motif-containing protein
MNPSSESSHHQQGKQHKTLKFVDVQATAMSTSTSSEKVKEGNGGSSKLAFSLSTKKKGKTAAAAPAASASAFPDDEDDDDRLAAHDQEVNTDIPKEPLVIPLQPNTNNVKSTLAAHVKVKQGEQQSHVNNHENETNDEDQAAIEALQREAAAAAGEDGNAAGNEKSSKMVIEGTTNTFQRNENIESKEQFQGDLEKLPQDVSVDSQVYKSVPISEFGAAMLRGMGWTGASDKSDSKKGGFDPATMPRPSRLGLGATPKLLAADDDAPATHGLRRRPRRHDQVQREEKLKRQQEEFQKEREKQVAMDKQQTLQIGSIVSVSDARPRRAQIVKLNGVPGLNMILVQYENETDFTKVKKGSVALVERNELHERPFREALAVEAPKVEKSDNWRDTSQRDDTGRDNDRDSKRDKSRDRDRERDDHKRRRDEERNDDKNKRQKSPRDESPSRDRNSTWLIPNIRVRVVSSKYGSSFYKDKGMVVDVTRKGVATLKMSNGQLIHAAERHLETALPKVGGNACILTGKQRYAKGKLLERDSKANRGAVQVFEDMSIVTTSLDDMAEWCGPLDDDLDHHHF